MTGKRFKLYEHKDNDYILDNPNEHLDFIEMLGDALTSEEIVYLLNELNDENQMLKKINEMTESTYHALQKKFHNWDISLSKCREENKKLKDLLKSMADQNNEIWLDDGRIYRLRKVFKGEWK